METNIKQIENEVQVNSLKICQILLELAEEVPIYNIGFYAYAKMFNKF